MMSKHKGLALKRIKKLIWAGGGYQAGMNCYILNTSGFDGLHTRIAIDTYSQALGIQRKLREAAYAYPHKFPPSVLTLAEMARIAHARIKPVTTVAQRPAVPAANEVKR